MRWVMRHLPALAPAALVVALLALTGCARTGDGPSKEKVESALRTLRADPDAAHFQTFVARSPATGQLSQQVLILVPVPDGAGYKIFDDYAEFLQNNTLPDQPGPG